jgi:hypothetical protein
MIDYTATTDLDVEGLIAHIVRTKTKEYFILNKNWLGRYSKKVIIDDRDLDRLSALIANEVYRNISYELLKNR